MMGKASGENVKRRKEKFSEDGRRGERIVGKIY
jgi:hypothetical protein